MSPLYADLSGAYAPIPGSAPAILQPIMSSTTFAPAVWSAPGANAALIMRCPTLLGSRSYRYFLTKVGVQSGNIQYGVLALSGTDLLTFTRVMDSGIIACPAPGNLRGDLGATTLGPGEYALFLWADNTTVTMPRNAPGDAGFARAASAITAIPGGVPASGTLANWAAASGFAGCFLEVDA